MHFSQLILLFIFFLSCYGLDSKPIQINSNPHFLFKISQQLAERIEFTSNSSELIWPSSPSYSESVLMSNPRVQTYPLLVIRPATAHDASIAMKHLYAARAFLGNGNVRVMGGRHSFEGYSSIQNGIVIDTSLLLSYKVSSDQSSISLGAGFTLIEAYRQLNHSMGPNYFLVGGFCPSVGIVGFTLGGGYNPWLSRAFGLAADNAISFDVILPNGEMIVASEKSPTGSVESDLYWALRGSGGGNFGLITQIEFNVHSISTTTNNLVQDGRLPFVALTWTLDTIDLDYFLNVFHNFTSNPTIRNDNNFGTNMLAENIQNTITIRALYVGTAQQLDQKIIPLLKDLPLPLKKMNGMGTFLELDEQFGTHFRPFLWEGRMHTTSTFALEITPPLIDVCVRAMRDYGTRLAQQGVAISLDIMFMSNMSKTGGKGGSYPFADVNYQLVLGWQWQHERDDNQYILLGESFLQQFIETNDMKGSYVNYIDGFLPDWERFYYGQSLERLQNIKRQVDPHNFWTFKQSIGMTMENTTKIK